jgi:hypothetical protein
MNNLGTCSQIACMNTGVYMMTVPEDGEPSGWGAVCAACEDRFGDMNLERAGWRRVHTKNSGTRMAPPVRPVWLRNELGR